MTNEIHVAPHEDGWAVSAQNRKTPIVVANTKKKAVDKGQRIARERGTDYIIHKSDGTIQDRRTPTRRTPTRTRKTTDTALHVIPHDYHWDVQQSNGAVIERLKSKYGAVQHGKSLAKHRGTDLVVHHSDGSIQERFNPMSNFRPALLYLGT